MTAFVGLDLGTSGLRALMIGRDGHVIASAEASYDVQRPHAGWSEQDPAAWIIATRTVFAKLAAKADLTDITGIAVAGHMHGATLLDSNGEVLRPCILWNDTRSHAQAGRLDKVDGFRERTGNIVFPGFTAPKLLWVAEQEPEIFAQVAKVLLPKDYLTWWLTGTYSADMSDSAGTSWLDVGQRDWSEDLLAHTNLGREHMPSLYEGTAPVGKVTSERARELGLSGDVCVAAGAGDNAAAACGIGALREGDGFVSLGTSGVLLAAKDGFAPDAASAVHTFCHAVPDRWYQMGVILAATDSLNWLARTLGTSPSDLSREMGAEISGPGTVCFGPYLSGERTPHNDSGVRGAFVGLDIATDRSGLTQAVFEGVAFAMKQSHIALKGTGTRIDRLFAIGGGAQSRYWVELLATVLDLPIDLPRQGEFGAAMGAARLAICAATGAAPDDVMVPPEIARTIEPRTDLQPAYEDAFATFEALYPALKALP
ncbi:xylulokinase [Thalassococcus sp. S3]|uniref:xylulokinase n=1 Tax=Thalassococcus sp. S3 TaxID=2017482 RepID=UPI0010241DA6|nr:xylulokinase [Thalassococcus sp. S3]QBF30566.1 xylulokinase [Thalassococcus sp. S3]